MHMCTKKLTFRRVFVGLAIFTSVNLVVFYSPYISQSVYKRDRLKRSVTRENHEAFESSDVTNIWNTSHHLPGNRTSQQTVYGHSTTAESAHTLAVIVPYRDSVKELTVFVPYIHSYLTTKGIRHKIYVINQVDNYRFNRGSLVNVGYLETRGQCDYLAMHDVDLLPLNLLLNYSFPADGPFHVAAPNLHPMYNYDEFIGGILLLTHDHYKLLNGMSNRYWGWGREDDEFYDRIKTAELPISRPENMSTGNTDTFFHIHMEKERPRDYDQYFGQRKKSMESGYKSGIRTIKYTVRSRQDLTINGSPFTKIDVLLNCDIVVTPWCLKAEDHYKVKELEKDEIKSLEMKLSDLLYQKLKTMKQSGDYNETRLIEDVFELYKSYRKEDGHEY